MSRLFLQAAPPPMPITIPDDGAARLQLGFAVNNLSWVLGLKEVDFVASLWSEGQRIELMRRRLDRSVGAAFQDVEIPLGHLAGKSGELRLETEVVAGDLLKDDLIFWSPPAIRPAPRDERPNLLLFSIDTLRPDHLGCYGYERDTSPTIDRLAQEGVLFSQAIASSSWTLPSHASMLTGLNPLRHGANRFSLGSRIAPKVDTLAELLWNAGYATAGFTDGGFVSAMFGFDRGFDIYVSGSANKERGSNNHLAENIQRASQWIDSTDGQPFFLFLHTYAVHLPYAPAAPFDRMFTDASYEGPCKDQVARRAVHECFGNTDPQPAVLDNVKALYDGEIRSMDSVFAGFLEQLDDDGLLDNTCVIITSDHGEEFHEHGRFFHNRADLYEELIRVPLIVWCPQRVAGGRTVDEQVSLTDVTPTILEIAGLPVPTTMDGSSLMPAVRGDAAPHNGAIISEVDATIETREGVTVAVRDGRYKLVATSEGDALRLYDLEEDPGETRNLRASQLQVAAELRAKLETSSLSLSAAAAAKAQAQPAPSTQPALDPAILERWRALGYFE